MVQAVDRGGRQTALNPLLGPGVAISASPAVFVHGAAEDGAPADLARERRPFSRELLPAAQRSKLSAGSSKR